MKSLFFFFALVSLTAANIKRHQTVQISGVALCKGKPAASVIVTLKERDYFTRDDIMAETHTDGEGRFEVSGEDNEVFNIAPYVVFRHDCNTLPGCKGESIYNLPSDAIGGHYNLTVDLGQKEEGDKQLC